MEKRIIRIYGIWFLVSLFVSWSVIPFVWNPVDAADRMTDETRAICDGVTNFSTLDDTVIIHYPSGIPTTNLSTLSRHFALCTSWFSQRIHFRIGSANASIHDSRTVSLKFYLPFVANYTGFLYCVTPHRKISKNWESMIPFVRSKTEVRFKLKDFIPSSEYSQFRCHHSDIYPRRWCEYRNLLAWDRSFYFASPALFEFPEPFIIPGPRAPPFDKETDQLRTEPIVQTRAISEIPKKFEISTEFSYFYGVFHNYFMLWHTIFDFTLPLYHFMKLLNGTDNPSNRRIYVRSDGVWAFQAIMRIFSTSPITILHSLSQPTIFERGTIGIEKLEKNIDPQRSYEASIGFHYDFDRSTGLGMREEVLSALDIPADVVGRDGKPLALLIDRGSAGRNMQNLDELHKIMLETCPHCAVEVVRFHMMGVEEQINRAARASVIVGFHGSGLAHVVWMAESRTNHSTYLVEILPYKYVCRDWYATAAEVAGVEYHAVMNENMPEGVTNSDLTYCWQSAERCPTISCHDLLRDQKTVVETGVFNRTWVPIARELQNTIATARVEVTPEVKS
jgi:hypothetical protein